MKKLLFLLLLIGSLHAKQYRYECSIVAMFKDETDVLQEWIEFHRLIGVEHFWLYNNNSRDDYLKILKPYILKGIVELIDWPCPEGVNWTDFQGRAYDDAILRSKEKTKWLAIIDTDEFIVPVRGKGDFKKVLSDFEKVPDCGGLTLFWLMFGTSHLYDIPPGHTFAESFLFRALQSYPPNFLVKTVCRPDRVKKAEIHICQFNPPYRSYMVNKEHYNPADPQIGALAIEPLRIHHYWTRSLRHLIEVKSPRRALVEGAPYSQERIDTIERNLNEVYDDTMLQFVPELKARLKQ